VSTNQVPTFGFVGVTASKSSINSVFPRWAEVLGLGEVRFDPIDLEPTVPAETYREVVGRIKADPSYRGALVTTHKVRLLQAARDLFDELGPHASLLGEVSCLSKRGDRFIGHAKDVITAGRSMDDFIPDGHFEATGGHVLCLGAGGAGLAIAVHLLTASPRSGSPERIVLVNRSRPRLDDCDRVLVELGVRDRVDLVANDDPRRNDEMCAALPPSSLVINATGMGKDRPGSPLTDAVRFPRGGLVWELNYRGELEFLHQAEAKARRYRLTIEDGWRYFVHGWSEVVAEVFDIPLTPETMDRLAAEAEAVRA